MAGAVAQKAAAQAPAWPPDKIATISRVGGATGDPVAVAAGDRILVMGPNGSGKTSLLRALAGLPPWAHVGTVRVLGADPATLPAARLSAYLAAAWQSPRDTLIGLTVRGEFAMRRLETPQAWRGSAQRPVAGLSSGENRRLGLDVMPRPAPPLLLLDEPLEGLDAAGEADVRRLIAAHPGAVVYSDHTGRLHDLCTRTVTLGAGAAPSFVPPGLPPRLPPRGATRSDAGQTEAPTRPSLATDPIRVHGIDMPALRFGPGLHVVHGPNGSGKTTLLRHAAGLTTGHVAPDTRLLLPHARDHLSRPSVASELAGTDPTLVEALVDTSLLPRHPLTLSGGEAQRVAVAKILGHQATVYLLDEPEAHLDAAGRRALWDLLALRVQEGACILAATHDPELLAAASTTLRLGAP